MSRFIRGGALLIAVLVAFFWTAQLFSEVYPAEPTRNLGWSGMNLFWSAVLWYLGLTGIETIVRATTRVFPIGRNAFDVLVTSIVALRIPLWAPLKHQFSTRDVLQFVVVDLLFIIALPLVREGFVTVLERYWARHPWELAPKSAVGVGYLAVKQIALFAAALAFTLWIGGNRVR